MASPGPLALAAARPVLGAINPSLLRPLAHRLPVHVSRWSSPARTIFIPATLSRPLDSRASFRSAMRIGPSSQYRMFGFGARQGPTGISQSLLATRESAANRNPNSATAQNAFYQVLLKANLPQIAVERYQSGLYASNEAADAAYVRALEMMKHGAGGVTHFGAQAAPNPMPSPESQAIAQAVAARMKGTDMATSTGQGDGTKQGPLHVIVEESRGSIIFRTIKGIFYFLLVAWVCSTVITLAVGFFDNLDLYKRGTTKKGQTAVKAEAQKTRFSDVHGCDEAKEELQEVVEFLKNPEKFSNLGGKLPRGVLLVGPPGTGKTLLARAVAGESGVPFFYMSGSEFDEVFVGVGAKRVRELFTAAKAKSPAIIFIDELDAIGGKRNQRDPAYMKQTLNQLLTELDGFEQDTGVIVIAATNHPQLLDKALTRPGRFDRHVVVGLPDVRGRLAILRHHAKKIKLSPDANFPPIASFTAGLSGAELENIVNQAAVRASKAKADSVTQRDLEWALEKVIMGTERRMIISPKEKLMTAYHEAGHALVHLFADQPPSELHKVTILARGGSLGHTAYIPEIDKYSYTLKDYMTHIRVALGGKVAEELAFGADHQTSGVSNDLEKATTEAFSIVGRFGMSVKLGPMDYVNNYERLSSETRSLVEMEVQSLLNKSVEEVRVLLSSKRKELDLLAKALVEYETLNKKEVLMVIRGESLGDRVKGDPGRMAVPIPEGSQGATVIPPVPTTEPPSPAASS
ncbi:related to AAA protease IAP-1 (mitochondrial intermembrane space) [Cephalotrichum gorgonifer]|uniref:Related to AAA protease IAP-1 (Mitochondrial intermembrane space) n=1 Tax=Cephalotrichum gorgonifer TaxID=2041049 RepID=A0AAE8MRW9_9PEZI|nr:related to AAA protease IAP-1 (mitochondrial intermembrane space) [Cephalotrichum gorgonifer]